MNDRSFFEGNFGLERETLRVDRFGRLAMTPHPFGEEPGITRDFCENQIELITPVCGSIDEMLRELEGLDRRVREKLEKQGERLWLYSNPPHITGEDEIPVAAFSGEHIGKLHYREQLSMRYGKKLMLFSGIHFNFSFTDGYLASISGGQELTEFRNSFYLRLYKQLSIHSWLPMLISAASPFYDLSFDRDGAEGTVKSPYASIRNSERGYWNEFTPVLDLSSLESLCGSIERYIQKGLLFSISELYLPIRLKPVGVNSVEALRKGISHVELRMFDLDPLEPLGINSNDLQFTHLLIMYLSRLPDVDFTPEMQEQAVRDHRAAALYDLSGVEIQGVPILERAGQIITEMQKTFRSDNKAQEVLEYEKEKLRKRLCTLIDPVHIYG
ncbi:MAG: glutathione synthase [Ruminococcus sp.]|nr:glutathione synthase [Ruminococcus sp.]